MNELRFDGRTAVVTGAGGNPSLGRRMPCCGTAWRKRRCQRHRPAACGARLSRRSFGRGRREGDPFARGQRRRRHEFGGERGGRRRNRQDCARRIRSIDILINNAGICRVVSFEDMTPADFRSRLRSTSWVRSGPAVPLAAHEGQGLRPDRQHLFRLHGRLACRRPTPPPRLASFPSRARWPPKAPSTASRQTRSRQAH